MRFSDNLTSIEIALLDLGRRGSHSPQQFQVTDSVDIDDNLARSRLAFQLVVHQVRSRALSHIIVVSMALALCHFTLDNFLCHSVHVGRAWLICLTVRPVDDHWNRDFFIVGSESLDPVCETNLLRFQIDAERADTAIGVLLYARVPRREDAGVAGTSE